MKRSLMADEYATLKKSKTINLHFERQIVVEGESESVHHFTGGKLSRCGNLYHSTLVTTVLRLRCEHQIDAVRIASNCYLKMKSNEV